MSFGEIDTLDPDAVVLVTGHESFEDIDWKEFEDAFVLDTRQFLGDVPGKSYTVGRGFE